MLNSLQYDAVRIYTALSVKSSYKFAVCVTMHSDLLITEKHTAIKYTAINSKKVKSFPELCEPTGWR